MDGEAIQTIANSLGMAVSSTEQFIEDILPQYAAMKVTGLIGWDVASAITIIIGIVAIVVAVKMHAKFKDDYDYDIIIGIISIVGALCLIIGFPAFIMCLTETIQWASFPQAMFLQTVLSSI